MLGKLIKYEIHSTAKVSCWMYCIVLLCWAVYYLLGIIQVNSIFVHESSVTMITRMLAILSMMPMILNLFRYQKNLRGNEGYFMFTLPIKSRYVLLSSILVGAIWGVCGILIQMLTKIYSCDLQPFELHLCGVGHYIIESGIIVGLLVLVKSVLTCMVVILACYFVSTYLRTAIISTKKATVIGSMGVLMPFLIMSMDHFVLHQITMQGIPFEVACLMSIGFSGLIGLILFKLTAYQLEHNLNL